MGELLELTTAEWLMVAATTSICVLGLLLPRAGNLLGLAFLGEDPAVARWRAALAQRRSQKRALRQARKAEKRARKQRRREAARAKRAARTAPHLSADGQPPPSGPGDPR